MFLTKLANILNFICQICNFFYILAHVFCSFGWDTQTRTNTYSVRSYTRNVPIQGASSKAARKWSAELEEKYENAWHSVA